MDDQGEGEHKSQLNKHSCGTNNEQNKKVKISKVSLHYHLISSLFGGGGSNRNTSE